MHPPGRNRPRYRRFLVASCLALSWPFPARAQARGLDASLGIWAPDTIATVWSVGYIAPLFDPIGFGISFSHVNDGRSAFQRTLSGGELTLSVGRDGAGPYLIGGAGVGVRHDGAGFDVYWSGGAGLAARPVSFLSVGLEARYRAEDQFARGFWRLAASDRTGFSLAARAALVWPAPNRAWTSPGFDPPSAGEIEETARSRGVSSAGSALAAEIVAAALDAMGTPYRWGGEGPGGFDCSGLIQYAYGTRGIVLPRVGRDQARLGLAVDARIESLNPGDILTFSADGRSVTHVGMYVGDGRFIHSASQGVKVSSLRDVDPDSRWWQVRWKGARRILR